MLVLFDSGIVEGFIKLIVEGIIVVFVIGVVVWIEVE